MACGAAKTSSSLTRAGCESLFDQGCDLVILACNTAASIALRRLQQTWLPGYRRQLGRPVNILGIIVPTIEAATGLPWSHERDRWADGDKAEGLEVLGIFSPRPPPRAGSMRSRSTSAARTWRCSASPARTWRA